MQSLTRIIAELDVRGLIERRQDPVDRRQIQIAISQRGSDLLILDAHRHNRTLFVHAQIDSSYRSYWLSILSAVKHCRLRGQ